MNELIELPQSEIDAIRSIAVDCAIDDIAYGHVNDCLPEMITELADVRRILRNDCAVFDYRVDVNSAGYR